MDKQKKCGYLLRYKKHIFCKEWRREYLVLFKDSRLLWYKEKERTTPEGGLIVSDSPTLIAIGVYTARVPNRPDIPPGFGLNQLIALGTKDRHKVYWFLSKSEEDASRWLAAICETLPPPPGFSDASRLSIEDDNQDEPSSSQDCEERLKKKAKAAGAAAFATGILVGGAMACALGWGNGGGWGIGGVVASGGGYDDLDVFLSPHTGLQQHTHTMNYQHNTMDEMDDVDDCDVAGGDFDAACDVGAIF